MDIGTHILGSVTNGSSGQKELQESKQDRSRFNGEDCLQRSSKLARTTISQEEEEEEKESYCKTMSLDQSNLLTRSTSLLSSDSCRQEHMLSFSGGYGSSGMMMNMNMQRNFTSVKGPFTLTQWAELEQQALIYKYITANVPVPSSLLISIKKSFYPYGSLPPSSFGWGTFHLGFAGGNMDPEPGRCRRTDGKKWRCSRDAVPDQKYCERHINRGRHRSRKPVEVQTTATTTMSKQSAVASGSNSSNARASNNRNLAGQYINPSTDPLHNNRVRNPLGSSVYPPTGIVHQKHEFGHISSDSLLNPNSTKSYFDFSSNQYNHSDNRNRNSWPESDWTQLSMSIPISSSSSSPSSTHNTSQEKIRLSPLRLSREIETEETLEPVKTWIPISWGNTLGGPLGEVLNNSTTNSPTLGSSPTGVLQKSMFCSLSNSSSVSSPVAESNRNNGDYFHYTT